MEPFGKKIAYKNKDKILQNFFLIPWYVKA